MYSYNGERPWSSLYTTVLSDTISPILHKFVNNNKVSSNINKVYAGNMGQGVLWVIIKKAFDCLIKLTYFSSVFSLELAFLIPPSLSMRRGDFRWALFRIHIAGSHVGEKAPVERCFHGKGGGVCEEKRRRVKRSL